MKNRTKSIREVVPPGAAENLVGLTDLPTNTPAARELKYTVAEIAQRWKCGDETVRRNIWSGELQSEFLGGKHMVNESVLIAFEKAAQTQPRRRRPNQKLATHVLL